MAKYLPILYKCLNLPSGMPINDFIENLGKKDEVFLFDGIRPSIEAYLTISKNMDLVISSFYNIKNTEGSPSIQIVSDPNVMKIAAHGIGNPEISRAISHSRRIKKIYIKEGNPNFIKKNTEDGYSYYSGVQIKKIMKSSLLEAILYSGISEYKRALSNDKPNLLSKKNEAEVNLILNEALSRDNNTRLQYVRQRIATSVWDPHSERYINMLSPEWILSSYSARYAKEYLEQFLRLLIRATSDDADLLLGAKLKAEKLSSLISGINAKVESYSDALKKISNKVLRKRISPISGLEISEYKTEIKDLNDINLTDELVRIIGTKNPDQETVDAVKFKLNVENKYIESIADFELKEKMKSSKTGYKVIEVKGSAVQYYYNQSSYEDAPIVEAAESMPSNNGAIINMVMGFGLTNTRQQMRGPLHGSCMRGMRSKPSISFYAENPDLCRLIVLLNKETNKIAGRAVVWTAGDNFYVDRIYYIQEKHYSLIVNYVESKPNYYTIHNTSSKQVSREQVFIPFYGVEKRSHIPYFDTLSSSPCEINGNMYLFSKNIYFDYDSTFDFRKNKLPELHKVKSRPAIINEQVGLITKKNIPTFLARSKKCAICGKDLDLESAIKFRDGSICREHVIFLGHPTEGKYIIKDDGGLILAHSGLDLGHNAVMSVGKISDKELSIMVKKNIIESNGLASLLLLRSGTKKIQRVSKAFSQRHVRITNNDSKIYFNTNLATLYSHGSKKFFELDEANQIDLSTKTTGIESMNGISLMFSKGERKENVKAVLLLKCLFDSNYSDVLRKFSDKLKIELKGELPDAASRHIDSSLLSRMIDTIYRAVLDASESQEERVSFDENGEIVFNISGFSTGIEIKCNELNEFVIKNIQQTRCYEPMMKLISEIENDERFK